MRCRAGEGGMTLVEVLLSLGLMASVLIAVASLFVLGGQRVKGSRNMTQAMAIASDVMEDIHSFSINIMPTAFPDCCPGGCAAATGCTVTSNSDTELQSRWLPVIEEELGQGRLEITLLPLGGSVAPPTFSSSEGLRLHVEVFWHEGTSERSAYEETVLF